MRGSVEHSMDATQRFVARLHDVLDKNYGRREFDLVQMAEAMRVSNRQLQRKVSALLGCGPAQYLRVFRLRMALAHLSADMPVGEVAHAVGFSSHAYFTSCFKAEFGATPSDFQARFRHRQRTSSSAR
jgi:transcriptional regulator GlxA family with amidase domain